MSKHHISWGGLSVRELSLDDSVLEPPRYCDRTTGNSKLHRFAQSDDCLHARKIIDGKDVNDIWNLVETRNSSGSTPLHVAAYYGSRDMINLLLECGAAQTERNKFGWLPGHYASRWSQPLDQKIAVGLKPRPPAMNSSAFTFRRIRDMKKNSKDTEETRKKFLKSDSGISVCGSRESLGKLSDSRTFV